MEDQLDYIRQVITTFQLMQEELAKLADCICKEDIKLPVWFKTPIELNIKSSCARTQISNFLGQLEYLDEQDPRGILLGPGIIAANPNTIATVERLNTAKLNFKQAMLGLKHAKISLSSNILTEQLESFLKSRPEKVSSTLNRLGLARLHLKQCYRQIPILDAKPSKVSWTWANTKAITKISKSEAIEKLKRQRANQEIINLQLQKLARISDNEMLAIVQELAPHLRSNIVFTHNTTTKRIMLKGAMPIFYPYDNDNNLPKFKPPGDKKQGNGRNLRKDVKLEDKPFLPSIHAFRYKEREMII